MPVTIARACAPPVRTADGMASARARAALISRSGAYDYACLTPNHGVPISVVRPTSHVFLACDCSRLAFNRLSSHDCRLLLLSMKQRPPVRRDLLSPLFDIPLPVRIRGVLRAAVSVTGHSISSAPVLGGLQVALCVCTTSVGTPNTSSLTVRHIVGPSLTFLAPVPGASGTLPPHLISPIPPSPRPARETHVPRRGLQTIRPKQCCSAQHPAEACLAHMPVSGSMPVVRHLCWAHQWEGGWRDVSRAVATLVTSGCNSGSLQLLQRLVMAWPYGQAVTARLQRSQ